jgi:hypothetical protein
VFRRRPGVPSPLLWGDENTVRERLRDGIADLKLTKRKFAIALPFNETEVVNFFRRYFGPVQRSFETLDSKAQAELQGELEQLWKNNNSATDGTTFVEAEYLEVIALRS